MDKVCLFMNVLKGYVLNECVLKGYMIDCLPLVARSLIARVALATASFVPDTVTVAGTVLSRSPLGVEIEAPVAS